MTHTMRLYLIIKLLYSEIGNISLIATSETEAQYDPFFGKYSCVVTIGETVLFFGGEDYLNQISQWTPRGLRRIGTLPFSFDRGTCAVKDDKVFLGFAEIKPKSCWER